MLVAPSYFLVDDEALQFPADRRSFGKKHGKPLADGFVDSEKLQFFAQFLVVAVFH